jgi:hypothetical protein
LIETLSNTGSESSPTITKTPTSTPTYFAGPTITVTKIIPAKPSTNTINQTPNNTVVDNKKKLIIAIAIGIFIVMCQICIIGAGVIALLLTS